MFNACSSRFESIGRRAVLVLALVASMVAAPANRMAVAADATPQDVIRAFYGQLVEVMKAGPRIGFDGRLERMKPVLRDAFNQRAMAQISVGPAWQGLSEAQKTLMTDRFADFSAANYARNFRSYNGQLFVVDGATTLRDGRVRVATTLRTGGGNEVALGYILQNFNGSWLVIDVYLDGAISQLATYRSEFRSVLRRNGIDGLVRLLEEKVTELRAG